MKTIPIYPDTKPISPSDREISLIIKPTEKCNFKCTFCSSTDITDDKHKLLDLDYIFNFLKRYPNTSTIIVNGGDPLMVPISYYYKIIEYLEANQLKAHLSLTSNLYPFYLNPDKWTPLFTHERVGIITSFQLDDSRLKHDYTPYSLEEFWKVSDLMLDRVGYRPDFISLMTNENEHLAIDHVKLAKEMDVECKLNPVYLSGRQENPFLLAKAYRIYLEIYKQGLAQWEYNTKAIFGVLAGDSGTCPYGRDCDSWIRLLQPSGDYYSCGSFGDDRKYPISYENEIYHNQFYTPLTDNTEIYSMKEDCFTCSLFEICNGCRKHIENHKENGLVEEHCRSMKAIEKELLQVKLQSSTRK